MNGSQISNPLRNLDGKQIMLASHSPRRRELLTMLGIDFTIAQTIEVDENYPENLEPHQVAPYLSQKKGEAYRGLMSTDTIVITADTVVIADNKILGKPRSSAEAIEMLKTLSGRNHQVVTGVTVTTPEKGVTFSASTEVEFAPLTDEEIDYYVTRFQPLDKAGAYGIQEWIGAIGVKGINGSYYNVMGLPVHRLYSVLKSL